MFIILYMAVSAHAQKPAVQPEDSSTSSPGNTAQIAKAGQGTKEIRVYDALTNKSLSKAIIILDIIGCDCARDCRINCKCCINQIVADENGRFTYDPSKQRVKMVVYRQFSREASDKTITNNNGIALSVGVTKVS
jgi:hypothetical protein